MPRERTILRGTPDGLQRRIEVVAIGIECQRRRKPGNDGIALVLGMPVLPIVDRGANGHAAVGQRDLAGVSICIALGPTRLTDEGDLGVFLERAGKHLRGRERGRTDDGEQSVLAVDALGLNQGADQRNDQHSIASAIEPQIDRDSLGIRGRDFIVQPHGEMRKRLLGSIRDSVDLHVEQRAQSLEMKCLHRAAQPRRIRLPR